MKKSSRGIVSNSGKKFEFGMENPWLNPRVPSIRRKFLSKRFGYRLSAAERANVGENQVGLEEIERVHDGLVGFARENLKMQPDACNLMSQAFLNSVATPSRISATNTSHLLMDLETAFSHLGYGDLLRLRRKFNIYRISGVADFIIFRKALSQAIKVAKISGPRGSPRQNPYVVSEKIIKKWAAQNTRRAKPMRAKLAGQRRV